MRLLEELQCTVGISITAEEYYYVYGKYPHNSQEWIDFLIEVDNKLYNASGGYSTIIKEMKDENL